jgi:hypothetical protein
MGWMVVGFSALLVSSQKQAARPAAAPGHQGREMRVGSRQTGLRRKSIANAYGLQQEIVCKCEKNSISPKTGRFPRTRHGSSRRPSLNGSFFQPDIRSDDFDRKSSARFYAFYVNFIFLKLYLKGFVNKMIKRNFPLHGLFSETIPRADPQWGRQTI